VIYFQRDFSNDSLQDCRAFIAVLTAFEIVWTSLHDRQELGIVVDKSEMPKPEHTEREVQEMISDPNSIIGQAPVTNAVYGSEVSVQSQFKPWNVARGFTILNQGWSSSWLRCR
jgi:hypothetical protein